MEHPKVYTSEQIRAKLLTDADFGIQFIIDNQLDEGQPNILIDRFKAQDYPNTDTKEKVYAALKQLLKIDAKKAADIMNNIPYDDQKENWTGSIGEEKPLIITQPVLTSGTQTESEQAKGSGIWGGILSGLGGLMTAIGGAIGSGDDPETGAGLTPEQMAAIQEQEKAKEEAERKRKQTNLIIGLSAIVLAIIIAVPVYNAAKKNKAKAKKD